MDAQGIRERLENLYGRVDWRSARGRLHVAAIHGPTRRVIAIGPAAPPSATDRFVLGFARARASVIVTTGAILRSEPELTHRFAEDASEAEALQEWRASVLGMESPPRLLVLSASGDFPFDHPALEEGEGWIWTTPEGRARVGANRPGFEVVVGRARGVAEALDFLARDPSNHTLLVEAGPSTSGGLYVSRAGLQELLLSSYSGPLAVTASGPLFIDSARVESTLGPARSAHVHREASGSWRFERFRSEQVGAPKP